MRFLSQNEADTYSIQCNVDYHWIINILYYYENTRDGLKNTDKPYIVASCVYCRILLDI